MLTVITKQEHGKLELYINLLTVFPRFVTDIGNIDISVPLAAGGQFLI